MCGLTLLRAVKRHLRGAEGPTFLFIKIESWNLVRTNGGKWYACMCVNSPMDRETALAGERRPPLFKTFFIYQDRSLKFRMHTAHIKWNTMIVTTGDKTDNRWQRVVPGDKLTTGDDGVQRVTTGDDGVKVQQTRFFTLFTRQRRVYQLVNIIKSEAMLHTRKNIYFPLPPILLNDIPISYNYIFKLLGI